MSKALAKDPRTAWAWSEFADSPRPLRVSEGMARNLLDAIPAGDHVEVFARGAILLGKQAGILDGVPRSSAGLLARTMRRWIVSYAGQEKADVLDGPAQGSMCQNSSLGEKDISWATFIGRSKVKVFLDRRNSEVQKRILDGAGRDILRLPSVGDVPVPPDVRESSGTPLGAICASPAELVTDWRRAEQLALIHMTNMGFAGSRLTGGSRDQGVDIVHPNAVAQVKMQGVPVSAPVIQQLRGARPHVEHHLFYSTSGFTAAATAEAADSSVALFKMSALGDIRPIGFHAQRLVSEASERSGGPEGPIFQYVEEVRQRVLAAFGNYGSSGAIEHLLRKERREESTLRAFPYLIAAVDRLNSAPEVGEATLQSVVNYYRHVELLAAVCCRELRVPYPGTRAIGKKTKTVDDYY